MTDDVVSFLSDGDRSLHILFGSQTGNSEDLAVKFGKRAKSYGLESTVHDMDGFDLASLASMSRVLGVSGYASTRFGCVRGHRWSLALPVGSPCLVPA